MHSTHARAVLAASPGPRISHRPRTSPASHWPDTPFHPPTTPPDLGLRTWLDVVREPMTSSHPSRAPVLLVSGALTLSVVALISAVPLIWASVPPVLAGLALAWNSRRPSRRAGSIMAQVRAQLLSRASARDLVDELTDVLVLDPDHRTARFLLAVARLEAAEPLAALLQLAPLRDRDPDHGEVVLVAACAYAQLGLHRDCLRMIDALVIPVHHPAHRAVLKMRAASLRALSPNKGAGLPQETRD